jgi:hypothetical protein
VIWKIPEEELGIVYLIRVTINNLAIPEINLNRVVQQPTKQSEKRVSGQY